MKRLRPGLPLGEVKFFVRDNALAFEASIPRPVFQGVLWDSDNHYVSATT